MTSPIKTRPAHSVKPSSQDPIQRWLDIFMPMTGLPKARQAEIREELEDHLRARTGDLMITGLSEPEAVQKAVNELGETAHLAKQFRTALKPRRNPLMQISVAAAAGIAITAGLIAFNSNNPGVIAAHAGGLATAVHGHADQDGHHAVPSHPVDGLRGQTYGGLFDQLAESTDVPVLVHWEYLANIGVDPETKIGLEVDSLPSHTLYSLIRERTQESHDDAITVEDTPSLIEFSTQSHFDRRTKQINPHDITDLIAHYEVPEMRHLSPRTPAQEIRNRRTAEEAGREILNTIMPLASRDTWTDFGGDLATGSVVGNSLIIDAPTRIHAEVEHAIEMMQIEVKRYDAEREKAAQRAAEAEAARADELRVHREAQVASLEIKLQEKLEHIIALEARKRALEDEHLWAERSAAGMVTSPNETEQEAKDRAKEDKQRLPGLHAELVRIDIEIKDAMAYRSAAQNQLMQLITQTAVSGPTGNSHGTTKNDRSTRADQN